MDIIESNERIVFQVKLGGQVLAQRDSRSLAESFVDTLGPDQQKEAKVVPVTENGQQVLFG